MSFAKGQSCGYGSRPSPGRPRGDTRSYPRGAFRPSFASFVTLPKDRGCREGRVAAAPGALRKKNCASARTTGTGGDHTGPPCAVVFRLIRDLVSAKSARMCERAVLTNRPSLDLSPYVLKGRKSLTGS